MDAQFDGLDKLEKAFSDLPSSVGAGVKLDAEAVVRGMVWEWGRIDINPGPKTMWSTSPGGYPAVLTITAPHGWIRVNRDQYQAILKEEMKKVNFIGAHPSKWPNMIRTAAGYAAERCANLMSQTAPIDTGLLRSSIHPVTEQDPTMQNDKGAVNIGDWF